MILSIDPGKSGAWALWTQRGKLVSTYKIRTPAGHRYLTHDTCNDLIDTMIINPIELVVIEGLLEKRMYKQSPRATNTTASNHGRICALIENSLVEYTPVIEIQASVWKKALGLDKDKDKSVALARELVDPAFLRKPRMRVDNVDIAEAILIGVYYGRKELGWTI